MKDFLNFNIMAKPEGDRVRFRLSHRKKDIAIEFTTAIQTHAEHIPDLIRGVMKAWSHKYIKLTRKALTSDQKAFYDALVNFHKTEGRPPTYEEISDVMGWNSRGTSFYFTKRLIAAGYVWLDEDNKAIPIDIALPELTE